MNPHCALALLALVFAPAALAASTPPEHPPLAFEINTGQTDPHTRFVAHAPDMDVHLTDAGAVVTVADRAAGQGVALRLAFVAADPAARVDGLDPLPGRSSYLLGDDRARWHTGIAQFARVRYAGVYPGVDVVYYGRDGMVEFDVELAPGADLSQVRLRIEGADGVALDAAGNLRVRTALGELIQHEPVVYQIVDGARRELRGAYALHGEEIAFDVPDYDRSRALVLDPTLVAAFLVGGNSADQGVSVASDASGNWYFAGHTATPTTGFPTTLGAFQTGNAGSNDVFVRKLSNSGSTVVYSTLLGGSGDDFNTAIAVDAAGKAYVVGTTTSSNFPVLNAMQSPKPGGASTSGFVAALDATGTALVYSTYLGGSTTTSVADIAVDGSSNAYVTGETVATDLPTSTTAFQSTTLGQYSAFVFKLDAAGARVFGTYIVDDDSGFGGDRGSKIAIDAAHNVYVAGYTNSFFGGDYNGVAFAQVGPGRGTYDILLARLNHTGRWLDWVSHIGGSAIDQAGGIAVNGSRELMLAARSLSTDLAPATAHADNWIWLARVDQTGGQVIESTWLGAAGSNAFPGDLAWDNDVIVAGNLSNPTVFPPLDPITGMDCGASCGTASTVGGLVCNYATAPLAPQSCTRITGTGGDSTRFTGIALYPSPDALRAEGATPANGAFAGKSNAQIPGSTRPDLSGDNAAGMIVGGAFAATLLPTVTKYIDDSAAARVGNALVMSIGVTNNSATPITSVTLTDVLPDCIDFGEIMHQNFFALSYSGTTRTLTLNLKPGSAIPPGVTFFANIAIVVGDIGRCTNTTSTVVTNVGTGSPASAVMDIPSDIPIVTTTGACSAMNMTDGACWTGQITPRQGDIADIKPCAGPCTIGYDQPLGSKIGTLIIEGASTFNGSTAYLGGGIELANPVPVTMNPQIVSVADALNLDVRSAAGMLALQNGVLLDGAHLLVIGPGSVNIGGSIGGVGDLVVLGGDLLIQNAPTFAGTATIGGGTATAPNGLPQQLLLTNNATLVSSGPLGMTYAEANATIRHGSPGSNFSIVSLNMADSARVEVAFTPGNATHTLYDVAGPVTLTGGILHLDFNGAVPQGLIIGNVINAPAGVTGCFSGATSDDPSVAVAVTCTANAVSAAIQSALIFANSFE